MPKNSFHFTGSRTEYAGHLTAKRLEREPVYGCHNTLPEIDDTFLTLVLGGGSIINGRLREVSGDTMAFIDNFYVSSRLRARGIGSRLLRAFIAESKARGAVELQSEAVSNKALYTRVKVLGAECLRFYDSEQFELGYLPFTLEQAMLTNDRIDALDITDADRPCPESHLGVSVDLTEIDTVLWERPKILPTEALGKSGVFLHRPAQCVGMLLATTN